MQNPTTPKSRKATTYLPDNSSQEAIVDFAKTMRELESYLREHNQSKAALVSPNGDNKAIPDEIFRALEQVANALANGNGVTVAPYSMLMTTQEAADFLGVSRPTFVKILDSEQITHEKRGRHRRVTLRNVVEYQNRARIERRAALAALATKGQTVLETGGLPTLSRLSDG